MAIVKKIFGVMMIAVALLLSFALLIQLPSVYLMLNATIVKPSGRNIGYLAGMGIANILVAALGFFLLMRGIRLLFPGQ